MKKELTLHKILLSLLGFVMLWAVVSDAWGYSDHFHVNCGSYIYAFFSRLIWAFPAILLMIRYSDFLHFSKKELISPPKFDKTMIIALLVSLTYVIIAMFIAHKGAWFNREIDPLLEAGKCIVIGCVEEIVFRGWGYNASRNIASDRKAAVWSTILFVVLHWPARFIQLYRFGTFDYVTLLTQSFSALIWGMVFCRLLEKGKSIWDPIVVHSLYDLMCTLLVG